MNPFDFLFPKICVGCGKLGTYFCPKCIASIGQGELVCPTCERPAVGGKAHPLCKRRYGLDGLWSLGVYQNPLRKAIQKLKYKFVRELGEVLVNLMVEYWAKHSPEFLEEIKKNKGEDWVIVPVPLHTFRQNYRGFNQSALIGQLLSKKLCLDYSDVLTRVKLTKPQVGMDSKNRRQNIKGAFALNLKFKISGACDLTVFENLKFLLVDDVWTTGSTLKECCYVLKRAGAQKIWAITLAR